MQFPRWNTALRSFAPPASHDEASPHALQRRRRARWPSPPHHARRKIAAAGLRGGIAHGEMARVGAEARASYRQSSHYARSEEHTSELQSLMRISYAVFCWKKKTKQ